MIEPANVAQALLALSSDQRQARRLVKLIFPRNDAPSGAVLVANRLDAFEGLSRDFQFRVEVLSDKPDIALKDVLGKMVTVELQRDDGSQRYFNGYVHEFRFVRNDAGYSFYDMVLQPWLAFLRYRRNNHLFHFKTVEQQTDLIFSNYQAKDWRSLQLGTDPVMTDACQFDETDYNYLHRRWEALGWHYHYEHRRDGHTLVLSGDSTQSEAVDGGGVMQWHDTSGTLGCGLRSFSPVRTAVSGLYAASSFDFKSPRPVVAQVPTLNQQGLIPPLEVYEYAGGYGFKDRADGDAFVRRRMEEIEAACKHFEASGDEDHVQCGRTFKLNGHMLGALVDAAEDDDYLIVDAQHRVSNNYETREGGVSEYASTFTCSRKKIPWRPGRGLNSAEPRIYGLQTALVVGPAGEEIHTDEFGRIRVQFHWDREGSYDERSSAWVRVATSWAGTNFGVVAIPRIGQEVVVQFLDGNPDRPLVTGSLYNRDHMPPWELPGNKTQTGLLSRSSPGGTPANANALRFEDRKGSEEVWLHAEKNLRTEVENDESHSVDVNRTKTIGVNETTSIGQDRSDSVGRDHAETITRNRTDFVGGVHDETIVGNRTVRVTQGAQDNVVLKDVTMTSESGSVVISAKTEILLVVGESYIHILPDQVVIVGKARVDINP